MTEIHERLQKLGTPFWFEKRRMPRSRRVPAVFVAVKNLPVRGFANCLCQFEKRKRREQIVMIDAGHEIACRELECSVCVFRNPKILRQILDVKSRLSLPPALQRLDCLEAI